MKDNETLKDLGNWSQIWVNNICYISRNSDYNGRGTYIDRDH